MDKEPCTYTSYVEYLILGTYVGLQVMYSLELSCPRDLLPSSLFPLMHHSGYVLPCVHASKYLHPSTEYTVLNIRNTERQGGHGVSILHTTYLRTRSASYVRLLMICPAKALPVRPLPLPVWDVKDCTRMCNYTRAYDTKLPPMYHKPRNYVVIAREMGLPVLNR